MPAAPLVPGLYYEPVQPVRPAALLMRGDIAAFIGLARRGPLFKPVRVQSLREATALFGDPPAQGHLFPALKGFFETGGDAAYVVRIADPDRAATAWADLSATAAAPGDDASLIAAATGWRAQASFNWPLLDPRKLARQPAQAAPAWTALVEAALRDDPLQADPGVWGDRLSIVIARSPLALGSVDPLPDSKGMAGLADSVAGLEVGSVVELTQGNVVATTLLSVVDPVRQRLEWARPLDALGLDAQQPIRFASVEFLVDVMLDGKLAERFDHVSPNPDHSRAAITSLAGSRYVSIVAPAADAMDAPDKWADPAFWPSERVHQLTGGRDGVSTLGAAHYLAAVQAVAEATDVALVAAPDLVLAPVDLAGGRAPTPDTTDCCNLDPPPRGKLQGIVIDAETQAPIRGATIELAETAAHATTDGTGAFTFESVPLALLTVTVSAEGFESIELLLQSSELLLPPGLLPEGSQIALAPLTHPARLSDDAILIVQQAMAYDAGPYRVAITDPPRPDMKPDELLSWRAKLGDSNRLAFFAPWIVTPDGWTVPPSGHVCGALAAGELAGGVHRAPANIPLRYATAVSLTIDDEVQGRLNPTGINAIRAFPGRGLRVWGSRTLSSDPEWRFLTARRVVDAIERTLEGALGWVVFEPNSPMTRQSVAVSIATLLERLWRAGILSGDRPADAFHVKCDSDNNSDDATARGELLAEVAVAPANPFEFVVFRIAKALDALSVVE